MFNHIRMAVVATNAEGSPDFCLTFVEAINLQYQHGRHYDMAIVRAEDEGYRAPRLRSTATTRPHARSVMFSRSWKAKPTRCEPHGQTACRLPVSAECAPAGHSPFDQPAKGTAPATRNGHSAAPYRPDGFPQTTKELDVLAQQRVNDVVATNREITVNMPDLPAAARQQIAEIAKTILGVETLEIRYADRLDFHDTAVWFIRAALEAAYRAGAAAARGSTA